MQVAIYVLLGSTTKCRASLSVSTCLFHKLVFALVQTLEQAASCPIVPLNGVSACHR